MLIQDVTGKYKREQNDSHSHNSMVAHGMQRVEDPSIDIFCKDRIQKTNPLP